MRISDWSSDVCSSDLIRCGLGGMDMISGTLRHRGMLFAAASVVAMGLAASPASAQSETAADEGTESEIVVTGFRASLENALNAKRDSNLTIESVNAEDIGKFPDQNVAESLQRLPGLQIDRENGQGSKVRDRKSTCLKSNH